MDKLVLVTGLVVGIVIRVLFAHSWYAATNSDEAAGMLMVAAAAHGHFSAFFWGANYGGTLMTVLEAPFVRVFGLHVVMFRAINTAVTLVDALLLLTIARRIAGYKTAVVACVLFWLLPPQWVSWSELEYVWWTMGMGMALATVLCCLRWSETRTDARLWPIGLFAGLTFWSYPLYGCIVLPALAAVLWKERRRVVGLAKTLALVPVGALPFVYANVTRGFVALHPQALPTPVPIGSRFTQAVTVVLPTAFVTDPGSPWAGHPHHLGWLVMGAAAIFAGWNFARRRWTLGLCGVSVVLWPFLVALSDVATTAHTDRYAFALLPALAIMAAFLLVRLSWAVAVGSVAILLVWSVWAVSVDTGGFSQRTMTQGPGLAQVAHFLEAHGRTHVYAGYWDSYVLSVVANERVTASPMVRDLDRVPTYSALADRAPQSTYVFHAGESLDTSMASWLATHPVGRRFELGGFALYLMDQRVPPRTVPLVGLT
jgi:hypothetical protein